ncbi:MAG: HAMP domain-containing sensor histidine kinase [Pseudomonadota bacterium]|nr:HAMP domain-containing sensor histidine kinase [Pseudomonadota bacterium]MDP1905306.1 HAMP domain-containing sensor histidine kinase [Pseudomonadota bacterium]MDP2353858.1 HAMP domain-containing sensor histidine kinase [Pseudomonadota bacterium]
MNTAVAETDPGPNTVAVPEAFWRSLGHLNSFRIFLAIALGIAGILADQTFHRFEYPLLFQGTCLVYLLVALLFRSPLLARRERFARQVGRQALVDIVCITLLMHLSGGNSSGIGLLLIVTLAAAGMLADRRMVLFWSATATLAVLGEQIVAAVTLDGGAGGFARAGFLSLGLFASALLSHALAKGAQTASLEAAVIGRRAAEIGRQAASLERINERVIQELPYAVMAVDGAGVVLQHNARAGELLGVRFFPHCGLGHCSPRLAEMWSRWCAGEILPAHPFQVGREGLRLRARFIELEPTRSEGAIVVLEDMTDLEAQAQRMKLASLGMLTANLAHEIRNPLSAISHAAGLLREEARESHSAAAEKLSTIISGNAERLNWLVDDVLSLNRRDRLTREALPLVPWLNAFVEQFAQREEMPVAFVAVQVAGEPVICFDTAHLEQIFWNLFRNASRFCLKLPGSIRIRAVAGETRVDVDVANDGPGIPATLQSRLFEPFYTTDKAGTGLGLYLARELAEVNGASLHYVDIPDGAMFRLSCQTTPC